MGVSTNLGTKVNRRKRAIRTDPDIVKDVCSERSDKGNWMVIKIDNMGEKAEEVVLNKFFQWNPEFLTAVINNLVLVRMVVDGEGASGGSEEIGEEIS